MKQNRGYSLIELLITISIVGIMVAMAVPNVSDTIKNSQLQSSADNLYSIIRFARAEAARQGATVFVGAFDGVSWASGAVAWTETDGNNTYNTTDTLIRRAYTYNTTGNGKISIDPLSPNTSVKVISFNGQGFASTAIQFDICDGRRLEKGRTINILLSGFSTNTIKGNCL